MQKKKLLPRVLCCLLISTTFLRAQGTAFPYSDQLTDGGIPATGIYDLQFTIYESATGGNIVGGPVTNLATTVSNGWYAVTLDFGPGVFDGNPRWLEIAARTNGMGDFITLNPRQLLAPVPYAIMAGSASNLLGTLPAAQLSGALPASQLSGTLSLAQLPGAVLTNYQSGMTLTGTNTFLGSVLMGTNSSWLEYGNLAGNYAGYNTKIPDWTIFDNQNYLTGNPALEIVGDYVNGVSGERYHTLFAPGNPGLFTDGFIDINGVGVAPPPVSSSMLSIACDVPEGIVMYNPGASTNAYFIDAYGADGASGFGQPRVFSVSAMGQLSLDNPYGWLAVPQILLSDTSTNEGTVSNPTYYMQSYQGVFTLGSLAANVPAISINNGNVGIGTATPSAPLTIATHALTALSIVSSNNYSSQIADFLTPNLSAGNSTGILVGRQDGSHAGSSIVFGYVETGNTSSNAGFIAFPFGNANAVFYANGTTLFPYGISVTGNVSVAGTNSAAYYSGNGGGLTNLNISASNLTIAAAQISGQLNSSQIASMDVSQISNLGTAATLNTNQIDLAGAAAAVGTTVAVNMTNTANTFNGSAASIGKLYAPTNTAPFTVTSGTSASITNSNNRSEIVLQIAFRYVSGGLPSCSIISTNRISTNSFVVSPLPAGLGLTASVTNLYTLPVQTNSIIRVTDKSSGGASVSVINYQLFGE